MQKNIRSIDWAEIHRRNGSVAYWGVPVGSLQLFRSKGKLTLQGEKRVSRLLKIGLRKADYRRRVVKSNVTRARNRLMNMFQQYRFID